MPKRRNRKQHASIIEINDSSSNGSQSSNHQIPATIEIPNKIHATNGHDYDEAHDSDDNSSTKSSASYNIVTRRKLEEQLPVASRTKSANKEVASMRLLSLDFVEGRREGLSLRSQENMTKLSRIESSKKKHSLKDEIHKTVSADMDDPELTRLLRKIAYCRVFTNYLFRQYDMLSIDFQLYSNLDELMINLKKRVGAYNAIRRSRKQMLLGDTRSSVSNSSGSREGSTL